MSGSIPTGPFTMPMYREGVPKFIRPWLYLLFLFFFELAGCVYLGSASSIVGSTGLTSHDVMFIGLCNVVGVNMPFPLLFRFKFRFTNHQLLINAALVIALCNFLALYTTSVPVLAVLSFFAGFFKLCGTFECASNIQLWMAPGRDFQIFFPILYIVVVGDIFLQGWMTGIVTYYFQDWQMMNWLIIGLMLSVALMVFILTKNFRFMKPLPLISVDWLGGILWSALMMEVIFLFEYGEYYNWADGCEWRMGVVFFIVTLALTLWRERKIRHPYISLEAFRYKTLVPLLALFFVAEWLNTTPKVLQNAFTGDIEHWGMLTNAHLQLFGWVGTILGCLFTLYWCKVLRQKYTRLLIIGGIALVAYQVMMYFYIAPNLPLEYLYFPLILQAFGYAIYFTALTIYLEELMPFHHFFMGLTISGLVRNGPVESIMSGIYSFGIRHHIADATAIGIQWDPQQIMMIAIKQLFGVTSILGIAFLIALMLYDVQPVRSTLKKIPSWFSVGKGVMKDVSEVISRHKRDDK